MLLVTKEIAKILYTIRYIISDII